MFTKVTASLKIHILYIIYIKFYINPKLLSIINTFKIYIKKLFNLIFVDVNSLQKNLAQKIYIRYSYNLIIKLIKIIFHKKLLNI